jgi:LPS-assembly protein
MPPPGFLKKTRHQALSNPPWKRMFKMLTNRFYLGLLLIVGTLSVAEAMDIDMPKEIPDEPFDIQAGRIEYTDATIIASGGVTGRFENVMLRADQLTVDRETDELHAEGNILFERENVVWQGTELDYNLLTQAGLFGPSSLYFEPAHMTVDHVERISTNEYLLRGATFTTCPKDSPHIRTHAKEARLIDEQYIKAKGVTFYIGKVPVMYVPYWSHKLSKSIFSFKIGFGSEWGAYALTTTTLPVTENIESITDVNLYSKRGVGIGQGFAWETPQVVGEFAAFYLRDKDPYAKYDNPTAREQISEDRYRFKLEHIQNFTDTHYLNTKWNYLSDPAILEEFFKREYRSNAQPENYASWVYGNSYVGNELFVSKRLNDFYNNTDRIDYSLDLHRSQLGDSPLYFKSENSIAHLERVYAENSTFSDYDSARIDSANGIYLPQRYGFLNLVPRATYRATYYSKTTDLNGNGDEVREIPGAGLETSLQATKILSDTERWYGKGLRHKIEPYADYIYENASIATNRLLQFDGVDELVDENKVQVGLRNVLQTKRNGQLSRFIDLDLYTYYLVEKHGAKEDFDSLYIDVRMPLTERVMVDMEGIYDWYAGNISIFDTRISYNRDDIIFSLEHLYQDKEFSLWTPRIDLFPKGNISLEAYARYEDRDNDLQEIAFIGYVNRCCMRYGLGYHHYDGGEQQIMFSIGLSAFPEAKISSGF